jgi:hypothetical protein
MTVPLKIGPVVPWETVMRGLTVWSRAWLCVLALVELDWAKRTRPVVSCVTLRSFLLYLTVGPTEMLPPSTCTVQCTPVYYNIGPHF